MMETHEPVNEVAAEPVGEVVAEPVDEGAAEKVDERDPLELAQTAFDEAQAAAGRLDRAMRPETTAVMKMHEAQYWALMGVHKKLAEVEQKLGSSLPRVADPEVTANIAALAEDYAERLNRSQSPEDQANGQASS